MRKSAIAVAAVLVGMLVAAPVATAAPSTGDAKKACADIVEGRVNYQSLPDEVTPTSAEVLAQMDLGAEACKNVSYTMTVYAGETDVDVVATTSGVPVAATTADPPRVQFQTRRSRSPVSVTWFAWSSRLSKSNGSILDRAPDTGCVAVPINSSVAGATRFR